MIRKLAGASIVVAGVGLCYWGWRLENKDREDQGDWDNGPYSGRGGAMVLCVGAILIFFGLLLLAL